ncbi:MAG: xylanase/chitin deacetylase [Comamonadaceae bacterium]|nr:MAG: xylanase/chitin deacetylase [Comamonadaceae bacterium]
MSRSSAEEPHSDHRFRRPLFRRVGFYLPFLVILGLALPSFVFLLMMQINGWNLPLLGLQNMAARTTPASSNIILYASPTSKAYFATIGGNYDTLLNPWRNYFKERALSVTELSVPAEINKQTEGVLVVPSALALNDQERSAIMSFKARGGGILATWATGTRNGAGEWAGWQLIEALGAKSVGEIPAASEARQLTLTGESPLSFQQPAGARIWMGKTTESLLRLTGDAVAARFMNWPRVLDESRRQEGAIVYSEDAPDTGRSVVFAFSETSWESRPFVPHQVIDDTLKWLLRQPSIIRSAWPNGKIAAQVIEMDTEQGFQNATAFASMMKSIDYRATFYVLTSVAIQFPDVLKALAKDFEIGYHGDVHVSFKDQPPNTQEQRIVNMRAELASVLTDTSKVTGFRAPTEGYDTTTEKVLQKQGIRHHAADPSRLEGRVPALIKMDGVALEDSLVVLARTQRDDINLYWEKLDTDQTTKALIDDFDLAIETGSLGFLSVHSQNFEEGSVLRAAMPSFLSHVQKKRGNVWLASSGQVAQWWRDRERVSMTSAVAGKRLDFNLTVKGDQPVNGVTLTLMLPQKGVLPTVRSTKIGTYVPRIVKLDDFRAVVIFDNLKPGDYVYQATFSL